MSEAITLRAIVVSKYKSVLTFSKAIGWSSRKAYDIVNGRQEATAHDIESMAELFGVTVPSELRPFFAHESTKCELPGTAKGVE